jgi:hypothetical protein
MSHAQAFHDRHRRHGHELPLVELVALDPAELIAGEGDYQLAAHGPEGDGAISAVGAEAEGIAFVEEPEIPAGPTAEPEELLE